MRKSVPKLAWERGSNSHLKNLSVEIQFQKQKYLDQCF